MNVAQRRVAVILSDEGREVLGLAAVNLPDSPAVSVYVEDTDDLGVWVRTPREDGDHFLLVRWEYILSLDIPFGRIKAVGLTP